ncbi:hypothetical protein LPJ61_004894 [Coemansia biformis]|uniref:Actin-like ATPase domain-containing protein n=1 Tax=Coemansia biformis TaxID=1286918 RepID=A0A9W7Y9T5_9FUNG|nr:hypothetical protein LPJ61_004894 [Coemansia biformis]
MVALHREESFVVIELGSYMTKALRDISDVNKLPSVQIRTRAGILRPEEAAATDAASPSAADASNGAMQVDTADGVQSQGPQPDEPAAESEDHMEARRSLRDGPGTVSEAGASDKADDADLNGATYVFGSGLESADSGSLEKTVDIIPDGFVGDWDALSALLRHIVTKELGIRISDNASAFLFSVPALWTKADLENLVRIAFEHLNVPTMLIMEQPLMALYGNGKVTGIVVDIGHCLTTVTPVVDSCIQSSCIAQSAVAGMAITRHLHERLLADADIRQQFAPDEVPLEFAAAVKESGLCKLQALPAGEAGGEGAPESQSLKFGGKSYAVSSEILASAPEVLVRPTEPTASPLASLLSQAVLGCEPDKRAALWESIHLVGGSSQFAGLKGRLQRELESTVLPASNIFALSQTPDIDFHRLPEYLVGWRNHNHWAAFLGACLVAKIALTDARHFVSRAEYNDSGPSIIHTKSF